MRRTKKPMPIPQWEFGFTAQTFNLTSEDSTDGDRIARENAELEQARRAADAAQTKLFSRKASHE